jgi:hypothetical protein
MNKNVEFTLVLIVKSLINSIGLTIKLIWNIVYLVLYIVGKCQDIFILDCSIDAIRFDSILPMRIFYEGVLPAARVAETGAKLASLKYYRN